MKKSVISIIVIFLLFACQNNQKQTKEQKQTSVKSKKTQWILNAAASGIKWTGYKTTGKIPVKGVFQTFDIKGTKPAANLPEAIKQAQASINIYSIFSDNEDRDKKLIAYLFEKMSDTKNIYARVENIETGNHTAMVTIHMNGHEKMIPMQIHIDEQKGKVTLSGKIDLIKDFAAGTALESFHKACFDKHTGEDGISKTWSEVGIEAELIFEKK